MGWLGNPCFPHAGWSKGNSFRKASWVLFQYQHSLSRSREFSLSDSDTFLLCLLKFDWPIEPPPPPPPGRGWYSSWIMTKTKIMMEEIECTMGTVKTSIISHTFLGNKLVITQMKLEHGLSALLQLHLHSRLDTWLQWIGQRQLQDKTRNI